jgi:hypothetical protein
MPRLRQHTSRLAVTEGTMAKGVYPRRGELGLDWDNPRDFADGMVA